MNSDPDALFGRPNYIRIAFHFYFATFYIPNTIQLNRSNIQSNQLVLHSTVIALLFRTPQTETVFIIDYPGLSTQQKPRLIHLGRRRPVGSIPYPNRDVLTRTVYRVHEMYQQWASSSFQAQAYVVQVKFRIATQHLEWVLLGVIISCYHFSFHIIWTIY